MQKAAFIDISPALHGATPVFPGDTPFHARRTWEMSDATPVNVSAISMSTHAGAHADAPLHYAADGASIDEVSLETYIGPCAVLRIVGTGTAIDAARLADAAARVCGDDMPARILIRTYDAQPTTWDPDFTSIAAGAVDWLADQGCRLIGVDTPSLDPAASKTMPAHRTVHQRDMRILECLKLDGVEAGRYELIAPPLKLAGLDAAPVRAVLRR